MFDSPVNFLGAIAAGALVLMAITWLVNGWLKRRRSQLLVQRVRFEPSAPNFGAGKPHQTLQWVAYDQLVAALTPFTVGNEMPTGICVLPLGFDDVSCNCLIHILWKRDGSSRHQILLSIKIGPTTFEVKSCSVVGTSGPERAYVRAIDSAGVTSVLEDMKKYIAETYMSSTPADEGDGALLAAQ